MTEQQQADTRIVAEDMGYTYHTDININGFTDGDGFTRGRNEIVNAFSKFSVLEYKESAAPYHWGMPDVVDEFKTPIVLIDDLHYHDDWSRLMLVILKIGNEVYPDYYQHCPDDDRVPYEATPWPRTFGMRNETGQYMFRFNAQPLFTADTLIEAAWRAVVYYITGKREIIKSLK